MAVRLARAAAIRTRVRPPTSRSRPAGRAPSSTTCPTAPSTPPSGSSSDLLDAGSGCETVEVTRYTMEGVPRANGRRRGSPSDYPPFGTIVGSAAGPAHRDRIESAGARASRTSPTGTIWPACCPGAGSSVPSMLLSCLSAHAALAVFDGIERTTAGRPSAPASSPSRPTPPTRWPPASAPPSSCPHSRLNTVPSTQVLARRLSGGTRVRRRRLERDHQGTCGGSEVVLVQGHPEYDPSSLLREYHRDARRYVLGERDDVPRLPLHCVAPDDWDQLQHAARADRRGRAGPGARRVVPLRRGGGPGRLAVAGHGHRAVRQLDGRSHRRGAAEAHARRDHRHPRRLQRRWHPGGGRAHLPDGGPRLHRCRARRGGARPGDAGIPLQPDQQSRPTTSSRSGSPPSRAGRPALVLASGMAAVSYSILTVARAGSNFVVAPQLYGATFTYFAHVLPTLGIEARFAADDRAESIGPLIDDDTCAVFCETIGNPAGNVVDLEAVADGRPRGRGAAHRGQHRRHPDDAETDRARSRRGRALADQVRRWPRHDHRGSHRRRRPVPVDRARRPLPDVQPARAGVPRRGVRPRLPRAALHRAGPFHPAPEHRGHPVARSTPSCSCRGWRRWRSASTGTRPTPGRSPTTWPPTLGSSGSASPASPTTPTTTWCSATSTAGCRPSSPSGRSGATRPGLAFFDSLQLFKRLLNLGDAKSLAIHPASTTHRQLSDRRADRRRHPARDDPSVHRPGARGRPDRRHRPGADSAGHRPGPRPARPAAQPMIPSTHSWASRTARRRLRGEGR